MVLVPGSTATADEPSPAGADPRKAVPKLPPAGAWDGAAAPFGAAMASPSRTTAHGTTKCLGRNRLSKVDIATSRSMDLTTTLLPRRHRDLTIASPPAHPGEAARDADLPAAGSGRDPTTRGTGGDAR